MTREIGDTRRWRTGVAWAMAAACLAVVTAAVIVDPGPLPGELVVVRRLQALGEPVPSLAELVRSTTGTEACLLASVVVAAVVVRRMGWAVVLALMIALVWMLVVQPAGKRIVDRPRPAAALVEVRADYSSTSYPSGHSLSTTVTWGAASAYAWSTGRRRWAVALALPVVATGVSSWIQGVHWPSDAIAGMILGAIGAALIARLLADAAPRRRPTRQE